MKINLILLMVGLVTGIASCKKDGVSPKGMNNGSTRVRKVRYELYTTQDFAGNQKNIRFGLFMRNSGRNIFDSSLATMKIKDIPDSSNRIVIEKLVPGNDTSTLAVGFNYTIDSVGSSWFQEIFPAIDTLKVLKYSFR